VLSDASINSLDKAIAAQMKLCAANDPWGGAEGLQTVSCRTGFATLGDLKRYFKKPPATEQAPITPQ
jgi:hypothetical protein